MQIIETSFCLLLSWFFYELLLRKETFFQLNRLYLLLMSLASFLLPMLHFNVKNEATSPMILPIMTSREDVQDVVIQSFTQKIPLLTISVYDVVIFVFLIGFIYKITKLFSTLWQMYFLIKNSKIEQLKGIKILSAEKEVPIASFFSFIFWNKGKNADNQHFILQHELVHVRQFHTIDVILMEVLLALQWFNPLMYYFRNRLKETHEFIADEYVAAQTGQRYQYAAVLVEAALSSQKNLSVVNTFSSFTKQRLIMLTKNRSPFWKVSKYLLALPLFTLFVLLFSFDLIAELPTPLPRIDAFWSEIKEKSIAMDKDYKILTTNDLQPEITEKEIIESLTNNNLNDEKEDHFIFYWGGIQLNFKNVQGNKNLLTASTKITMEKLEKVTYRMEVPYFWNGKILERDFQFRLCYFDSTAMILHTFPLTNITYFKKFTQERDFFEPIKTVLRNAKKNDLFFIDQIKSPSTGEKNLTGKIILTDNISRIPHGMSEKQFDMINDFLGSKEKLTSKNEEFMFKSFKWGDIDNNSCKITKEQLLNSILYQPILYYQNGQPAQKIRFNIAFLNKDADPVLYPVSSDLLNNEIYRKYLNNFGRSSINVSKDATIYLDEIKSEDAGKTTTPFSIVLKIIE